MCVCVCMCVRVRVRACVCMAYSWTNFLFLVKLYICRKIGPRGSSDMKKRWEVCDMTGLVIKLLRYKDRQPTSYLGTVEILTADEDTAKISRNYDVLIFVLY